MRVVRRSLGPMFESRKQPRMTESLRESSIDKQRSPPRMRMAVVGVSERRGSERSGGERSETERCERARSGETPTTAVAPSDPSPDPEVIDRPARRVFGAEYKLKVLEEADSCRDVPGAIGSLLRREGLSSSNLRDWRQLRRDGLLKVLSSYTRGRKPVYQHPLAKKLAQVEREKRHLERRLKKAELLLDIQKKVSEALGISLEPTETGENS